MKKELYENFEVQDGLAPVGIVTILDGNSKKIVFKGKNMVVKGGRDYMAGLFEQANSAIFGKTNTTENRKITKIKFGNGAAITTFLMDDLESTILAYDIKKEEVSYAIVDNHNVFTITKNISFNAETFQEVSICELGLFLVDAEATPVTETLFSRVTFDAIPLGVETSFIIKYSIYL